MKLISTAILVLFTIITHSQKIGYYTTYFSDNNDYLLDAIEMNNGELFVAGFQSAPDNSANVSGIVLKINETGIIIDTLIISFPEDDFYLNQILLEAPGSILLNGCTVNRENRDSTSLMFVKLDENLQINDFISFRPVENYIFIDQTVSKGLDDDILITGTIKHKDDIIWQVFAYRFSGNLDSLHFKVFNDQPNSSTMGLAIKQLDSTTYFIHEGIQSYFYVTDDLFNILSKHRNERRINSPYGIKWDTDTSFYLAGEWNDASDDDIAMFYQPHFADTTLTYFNWWGVQDTLDMTANDALDFKNKDSIFVGGTTNFGWNLFEEIPTWCFILQTDSTLNVRWEKFIGGDANYRTKKILATRDGGCLIGTTFYDYQNSPEPQLDMRIFKLDKYGQLVNMKDNPAVQITEAIVYPNPGDEYLKVRIAAQHSHSVFELYSMDGKLMIRKNISGKHATINTSELPAGTYIYKVYNSSGLDESGKWVK